MISAIVSAYYAEKFLAGRLENLLGQEPRPEIIVICQKNLPEAYIAEVVFGSRNGHKVSAGSTHRILYTNDIPTVYAAWNLGIREANGEYLTNANCDDRLYPGGLAVLAKLLDENPRCGMAYGDVDIVEQVDGDPVGRFTFAEGGLKELLEGCFTGPMPMWRKSVHEEIGYFDAGLRSAGDYEFWLRAAAKGIKFVHSKQVVGAYTRRKDSVEHRESVRSVVEAARVRARYR